MALFVIGDLHLSLGPEDKPMDVFDGWDNYIERLTQNWKLVVSDLDTVIVAGDFCWAMDLKDTLEDFSFLHSLPGKKIILKGNHDYWWTTLNKMNGFLTANGFDDIQILHNNSFVYKDLSICGTRGWLLDINSDLDEKILFREVQRLQTSINCAQKEDKIVFLHYPPIYYGQVENVFTELLRKSGIKKCYYGHLHGNSIKHAFQGMMNEVEYKLISADSLGFLPYRICD